MRTDRKSEAHADMQYASHSQLVIYSVCVLSSAKIFNLGSLS